MITGGAGFIGSHVVRHFVERYSASTILNLDTLTYAGNLENLSDVEGASNYRFVKGDIRDRDTLDELFRDEAPDAVVHLAAESHVDRSIDDPRAFIRTNVEGTLNLLDAARSHWEGEMEDKRFLHVSTDEVYGSLGDSGYFTEETPYDPKSPYAASKASSDHLVRAYHNTFGLPILITNCSNNYGPNQFPEKLIPLMINNIEKEAKLPVYGKGENVRDWLWVKDHAMALERVLESGKPGSTYNIGGKNEWRNIDLVRTLCRIMDQKLGREEGRSEQLIEFVSDRKGHDLRYAIDPSKIESELGWRPSITFEEGLEQTVEWYLENKEWLQRVTSGAYQAYYERMYGGES